MSAYIKIAKEKISQDATEKVENKFVCDSAIQDIEKTGFRLPTEAEWEFSGRYKKNDVYAVKIKDFYLTRLDAGSGGIASTGFDGYEFLPGETADSLKDKLLVVANFSQYWKDGDWANILESKGAIDVGSKQANDLGIFDMSGDVWEWCFDFYDSNPAKDDASYTQDGVVLKPQGAKKGTLKCTRGGSWESPATKCSVGYRRGTFDVPSKRSDTLGFKLCYSVK